MVSNFVFDVVVLGAGGGGCATAITAAREGASVALLSKESIGVGNTRMAGGLVTSSGIADGDSPDAFKEDMLRGGEYLNNLALVENLSKNATAGIQFVESLGQFFFRDEEGRLSGKSASRLGGHSFARSYTSSGKGVSITRALRHGVANTESIAVFEDTFAVSLLKEGNEIKGVLAVDLKTSACVAFWSKATILATGGCGWLYYPHTTNIRFRHRRWLCASL